MSGKSGPHASRHLATSATFFFSPAVPSWWEYGSGNLDATKPAGKENSNI